MMTARIEFELLLVPNKHPANMSIVTIGKGWAEMV
jgi:hypothetical protein